MTESRAVELEPGLFRIVVLGEPVSWKRPEYNPKTGKTFVDQTTVQFRSTVREACRPIVDAVGFKLLEGPIELSCMFYYLQPMGWKKERWHYELAAEGVLFFKAYGADLDNLIKGVQDALQGVVMRNDRQVVSYGPCGKLFDAQARVEIMLRVLPSEYDLKQLWRARQPARLPKPAKRPPAALPLLEQL